MKQILKNKKFITASIVTSIVVAVIFKLSLFIKDNDQLIAFGDSTVFGDINNNQVSYIDYLSTDLIESKIIKNYSKSFSRSSLKSGDLLSMIENNAYTIKNNQPITIEKEVKNAKIITVSVGMADILDNFQYLPSKEVFEYDEVVVNRTISIVQSNTYEIIKSLQSITSASIYIVGYYFPFPALSQEEIDREHPVFENLNTSLATAAEDSGVYFINTEELSDRKYLPSVPSYLLNDDGNKYMANVVKQQLMIGKL